MGDSLKTYTKIFGAVALLITTACDRLDAEKQKSGRVEVVDNGSADASPLMLDDHGLGQKFDGHLLIWKDSVKPEQIATISRLTVERRVIRSKQVPFLKEKNQVEVGIEQVGKDKARNHKAIASALMADTAQASRQVATGWFEDRLAKLEEEGKIDGPQAARAEILFQAYCDYKVWELAASSMVHDRFTTRPTPQQMCEAYYADRYFQDDELCGEAPTDGGRSYFHCLWKEGVMKTPQYTAYAGQQCKNFEYQDTEDKRGDIIAGWLKSGALSSVLGDKTEIPFFDTIARGAMLTILDEPEVYGEFPPEFLEKRTEFQNCINAFKRHPTSLPQDDLAGALAMEKMGKLQSIVSKMPDGRRDYQLLEDSGLYALLEEGVYLFGDRGESVRTRTASVSDQLYNKPIGTQYSAGEMMEKAHQHDALSPILGAQPEIPPELEKERKELAAKEQELSDRKAELEEINAGFEKSVPNQALTNAINAPGAVAVSRGFILKAALQNGVMHSDVEIGGAKVSGCFDLESSRQVACEAGYEATGVFTSMAYEGMNRKLTLEIVVTAPVADAITHPDSSTDLKVEFSTIPAEQLEGLTMRLVLKSGALGELDIFTGKVYLLKGTEVLHEGSLSGDNINWASGLH